MPGFDDTLDRLEALGCAPREGSDGQWSACCPVHEDDDPSLSLREGDAGGTTVVTCHGPCYDDDRDLFLAKFWAALESAGTMDAPARERVRTRRAQRPRDAWGPVQAEYVYYSHDGYMAARKTRHTVIDGETGKERRAFSWYRPLPYIHGDGYSWLLGLDGLDLTELALYRAEQWRGQVAGNDLGVTEGESDADALRERGLLATCPPNGSGGWCPRWSEYLRGARMVVVYADDDERGLAHAEAVRAALVAAGVPVVVLRSPYANDVRAHLELGYELAEMVVVAPAAFVPAAVPTARLNGHRHRREVDVRWAVDVADALPICE